MWDAVKRTLGFTSQRQAPAPEPAPSRPKVNYATDIHNDDSVNFFRRWVTSGGPARTADASAADQPSRPSPDGRTTGSGKSAAAFGAYKNVNADTTNGSADQPKQAKATSYGLQPDGSQLPRPQGGISVKVQS